MKKASKGNQLLWLVAAAFALQIIVWTAWFVFANKNRPTEIPLEHAPRKAGKTP